MMQRTPLFVLSSLALCGLAATAAEPVIARRPGYPYRIWYAAPGFETKPELYPFMTAVNSGKASPQYVESKGKTYLQWAFGTNLKNTTIPNPGIRDKYYSDRFLPEKRNWKPAKGFNYPIQIAGPCLDEWIFNKTEPESYQWIRDGLHAGRSKHPDTFVAIWAVDMKKPQLAQTIGEDSSDLLLVEGYDLTPRGLGLNYNQALGRQEEFHQIGLGSKTIMGLGHMTDKASWNNLKWDEESIRLRMEEVKRRYPDSPGISFFPGAMENQVDFDKIMKLADALSGEYWPDLPIPDGLYSITPQTGTTQRLEAHGFGTKAGTPVVAHRARYPQDTRHQKWRFTHLGNAIYKIQPSYSTSVSLDASNPADLSLAADENTAAQKWKLSKVTGGYRLSPLSAPDKALDLPATANGSPAQLRAASGCVDFALAPEVSPRDVVPPFYQAEDAILAGGVQSSSRNAGYMGTGYAALGDKNDGRSITFTNVDGGPGGVRTLVFRYALASNANPRTPVLEVNGVKIAEAAFQPTDGDWRKWENHSMLTTLKPGATNEVVLRTTGKGGPDIDKLTINAPAYRYQDASLSRGARPVAAPWGGDGGFIDLTESGATLTITGAEGGLAESPGRRGIHFRFANGADTPRTLTLGINGQTISGSFPTTGGWNKWHDLTVFRDEILPGPANEITLTATGPGIRVETISIHPGYVPQTVK